MAEPAQPITTLLAALHAGDVKALDSLVQLLYGKLRGIAGQLMRGERHGHTLQPTALVNEALVRLLEGGELRNVQDRRHFFYAAARAMRQVLVDHARRRRAEKRGGARRRTPLDETLAWFEEQRLEILGLDEALARMEGFDPRQAQIVQLRYFAGLSIDEIAAQLDVSDATVENDLRAAKAWLRGQLGERSP